MEALKIKQGTMTGFHWEQFRIPFRQPVHVDVLIDPQNLMVGWLRTKRVNGLTEAVALPETYGGNECIHLLSDGVFLGVYPGRLIAADTVLKHAKHTRVK